MALMKYDGEDASRGLLKPREAAEFLQVSERTLWTMSKTGGLPRVQIGRAVRYDLADLNRWIEQAKNPGKEAA
jgi:excisionase family DNA binding protein